MTNSIKKLKLFGSFALVATLVAGVDIVNSKPSSAQSKSTEHNSKEVKKTAGQGDYKIGERLKQTPPQKSPTKDVAKDSSGKPINFKTISWDELLPADWDPSADFKNMDLGTFNDADPRAISALKKLRNAWDNAPTNPLFNQKYIRIPGFVVPLDIENGKVAAFLLVPYFGGCLHTPPPPANQIIEVQLEQAQQIKTMEPVWVSGLIDSARSHTELGTAGYRLNAVKVDPYTTKNKR